MKKLYIFDDINELQATLTDRQCEHQPTEKKASRTF
jgi:hypothetical protein